jgi:hypothetical protein
MFLQEKNTLKRNIYHTLVVFDIIVAVACQSIFCLKIHQNNIFFIF